MKDSKGTEIKAGQKLIRIVDGMAVDKGYKFKVVEIDGELVADGGFVKETLYVERAKEFSVIEDVGE